MAILSAKIVEAKLRELGGNMAAVARALGVTRGAVFIFVRDHPTLKRVMLDCREARIDVAESALDRAVLNGEGWAISLTLKTIGKDRGYIERQEVENLGGQRIILTEEIVDGNPSANGQAAPGAGRLPPQ
jgi:hypothetical protein